MSRAGSPPTRSKITFDIAGLPLHVKGRDIGPLPGVLTNFITTTSGPTRSTHCLDAGLFFSQPRGRLSSREFNDRLLSHIYSQLLSVNSGVLLHATAVMKDEKAYIFFGSSGGGKSTVAALSRDHDVLGDDVVAVRKIGKAFYAFPTPWRQSGFVKAERRLKAKVSAIFFLEKSKRIHFEPLAGEEALSRILRKHIHFFRYTEPPLASEIFYTVSELAKTIPAYDMEFKRHEDFWPELIRATDEN